jgi:hypothetical protein
MTAWMLPTLSNTLCHTLCHTHTAPSTRPPRRCCCPRSPGRQLSLVCMRRLLTLTLALALALTQHPTSNTALSASLRLPGCSVQLPLHCAGRRFLC